MANLKCKFKLFCVPEWKVSWPKFGAQPTICGPLFLTNQSIILLIISTAVFLQRNEISVMANHATINSMDVKTIRNSN